MSKQSLIIIFFVAVFVILITSLVAVVVLGILPPITRFLNWFFDTDPCHFFLEGCYDVESNNFHLAKKYLNSSYCDDMACSDCSDMCYQSLASIMNETYLCDKIKRGWWKDYCISEVATNLMKPELCSGITNSSNRLECESITLNDSLICDKIPEIDGETRDWCYEYFVEQQPTEALCDKITSNISNDNCYRRLAVLTRNVSYCYMPHTGLNEYCKNYVELIISSENATLPGR